MLTWRLMKQWTKWLASVYSEAEAKLEAQGYVLVLEVTFPSLPFMMQRSGGRCASNCRSGRSD